MMITSLYEPLIIEPKWQDKWEQFQVFRVSQDIKELQKKPKYYVLDMFPYPSGAGLHVGHPEGYTATDVIARLKRMQGFNVLHPMGWDAFGLPTERAAARENTHPAIITKRNICNFKKQIRRLGFSYDWSREINTTDHDYYKWTQWIFLKLYEKGLAYLADVKVNWCQKLGTVLANEEVKDNKYIETGDIVEQRTMRQWVLKITAYAERLLMDLDDLDWPENVKEMQRNWIGKSEGYEIDFQVENKNDKIIFYTDKLEAILGCTFCVISSEHYLVRQLNLPVHKFKSKNEGFFTGIYLIHPVNKKSLQLWCSDYVLNNCESFATVANPSINEQDYQFAKSYNLPIVNFENFNITEEFQKRKKTNYKLKDWLFSRQRYWGEPFPVLILPDNTIKVLKEEELPICLPLIAEYKSTDIGEPPLARAPKNWLEVRQTDGTIIGKRETNTMPQWAGSCWYYLRFLDPKNASKLCNSEIEKYWMPVDLYIGGTEHAVLHLLYARFWHKVLYDCGVVSTKEPFKKLFNQGMILANSFCDEDGKYYYPDQVEKIGSNFFVKDSKKSVKTQIEKMSKSKYNVINPNEVIDKYGADAMRLYELFMGPLDQTKSWNTNGPEGVYRFLQRVWRLSNRTLSNDSIKKESYLKLWKTYNKTLKIVTEQTLELKFNTAIAQMMIFVNEATSSPILTKEILCGFIKILSPYAPHIAEEIWEMLGEKEFISNSKWPVFDEQACTDNEITFIIQINGKKRAEILIQRDSSEEFIKNQVLNIEKIKNLLKDKQIKKTILIKEKLINIII